MSLPNNTPKRITVGDLKKDLALFDDTDELDFSGLEFYRTKRRGPALVQIEFSETILKNDQGDLIIK